MKNTDRLFADTYYHVFNRTNNKERLFRSDENKAYFLQRLQDFIHPFCRIYCYCLLYNHFHLSIKVRSHREIRSYLHTLPADKLGKRQKAWLEGYEDKPEIHTLLCSQFSRLFNSYSKAFNRAWKREGNLFNRPFKRKEIIDEQHLRYLVYYIQANSSKHGGGPRFQEYPWTSFQIHLSNSPTFLEREELLSWFGGKEAYNIFHQNPSPWIASEELGVEE